MRRPAESRIREEQRKGDAEEVAKGARGAGCGAFSWVWLLRGAAEPHDPGLSDKKIPTVLRSVGNCGGLLRGRALISAMFRGR